MSAHSPRLPPECVRIVLLHLADMRAYSTLVSMLLVDRSMFEVAVSVLYRDPFQCFEAARYSAAKGLAMLIYCLVQPLPESSDPCLAKVINLVLGLRPKEKGVIASWSSSLDSLSRHFPTSLPSSWSAPTPKPPIQCALRNYLEYIRHLHMDCDSLRMVMAAYRNNPATQNTDIIFRSRYTSEDLRLELTREIVDRSAEQLLSLTIPIWDIQWYLTHVRRFKSLEHVRFLEFEKVSLGNLSRLAYEDALKLLPQNLPKLLKDEAYALMTMFVREHSAVFNNLLRSIECYFSKKGKTITRNVSDMQLVELTRLLPPLTSPSNLNEFSTLHFLGQADKTNVGVLESIRVFPNPDNDVWSQIKSLEEPFLQKCRRLKELEWWHLPPNSFEWAVRERKQWLERVESNRGTDSIHGQADHSPMAPTKSILPSTLVPLKSIIFLSPSLTCDHVFDDILFAFSDTLKELRFKYKAKPGRQQRLTKHVDAPLFIGRQIYSQLSRLQHLVIQSPGVCCIWLRPEALDRSPLIELDIDNSQASTLKTAFTTPCSWIKPIELEQLQVLRLLGPPSATFNPNTFHSTKQLKSVILSLESWSDQCRQAPSLFPPVLWRQHEILLNASWDWHLPFLTRLVLGDLFAMHFKFQMLRTCPALKFLHLTLPVERTLSEDELLQSMVDSTSIGQKEVGTSAVDPTTEESLNSLVVEEGLDILELEGAWSISMAAWRVLLRDFAPNISFIFAPECIRDNLKEWIEMTREMTRLQWVKANSLSPLDQETGFTTAEIQGQRRLNMTSEHISYSFRARDYRVKRQVRQERQEETSDI